MQVPDDVPLVFDDLIRGEVSAPRPDDQVLRKADGFPTYHLAVVVDDHVMGITHVVRGEEWIASTPKHLLLYDWLGWPRPQYAHMPLLRNADKSKISKRKNPAARLRWFEEEGFLPEALRNFLALVGYSMPDGQEVFSLDEMIASFDWRRVNPVGPVFDVDKLRWLNGHYVRDLPPDELARRLTAVLMHHDVIAAEPDDAVRDLVRRATPLVQERMTLLTEAVPLLGFLFVDEVEIDPAAAGQLSAPALRAAHAALAELAAWETDAIHAALERALVDELGLSKRKAYGPVRVAVTGRTVSPPLFESLELLGRERGLARIERALGQVAEPEG